MNRSIYTKLAISNLKNNRKSYIPYVLTAILTVMMYYMMANLAANSPMNQEALQIILSLSVHVIEIFALIFLFYTNSFLIKRRKKELEYKKAELFQEEVYLDTQKSAQVQARIEELEELIMESMETWEELSLS